MSFPDGDGGPRGFSLQTQNLMRIPAVRPMSLTPCTKSCTFSRRQDAGISYLQDRHPFRGGLVWTFICLLWRCVCIPQSSGESHCHLVQRTTQETYPQFNKETNVRFDEAIELALNKTNAGLLLYVTDCVNVDEDALNFACWLVERHGAHIELLCVIDPGRTDSSPDAQMGIQYRLETLARTVRHLTLTKNAEAVLLFGCADDVIPKRAAAVHARLVALQMNNSANYNAQEKQVRRIAAKCDCPILAFRQRDNARLFSISGSVLSIRNVCAVQGQSFRARCGFVGKTAIVGSACDDTNPHTS
jgi:hypothetical protein